MSATRCLKIVEIVTNGSCDEVHTEMKLRAVKHQKRRNL